MKTLLNLSKHCPLAVLFIISFVFLTACKEKSVPLPPELTAVQCNPEHQLPDNYALLDYGQRQVYALCLSAYDIKQKQWLKCDNAVMNPNTDRYCNDSEVAYYQVFSRTADDTLLQGTFMTYGAARDADTQSTLSIRVNTMPLSAIKKWPNPDTSTFYAGFVLPSVGAEVPESFTLASDVVCDRIVNALNSAPCRAILQSGDLTIQLALDVRGTKGDQVSNRQFHAELSYWLAFLKTLIVEK